MGHADQGRAGSDARPSARTMIPFNLEGAKADDDTPGEAVCRRRREGHPDEPTPTVDQVAGRGPRLRMEAISPKRPPWRPRCSSRPRKSQSPEPPVAAASRGGGSRPPPISRLLSRRNPVRKTGGEVGAEYRGRWLDRPLRRHPSAVLVTPRRARSTPTQIGRRGRVALA